MLPSPVTSPFLPLPTVTPPKHPKFFEVRPPVTLADSTSSTLPFSVFFATLSIQSTYSLFQKYSGYTPFLPTLGNALRAPRLHTLRLCDTLLPALPNFGGFPKMNRWLLSLLSLLLAPFLTTSASLAADSYQIVLDRDVKVPMRDGVILKA